MSQDEVFRLRQVIVEEKAKARELSRQIRPLRKALEELEPKLNEALVQVYRAELKLAKLEDRIAFVPEGVSGKQQKQKEQVEKLVAMLSDEKRAEVLRLLNASTGLGGGVGRFELTQD